MPTLCGGISCVRGNLARLTLTMRERKQTSCTSYGVVTNTLPAWVSFSSVPIRNGSQFSFCRVNKLKGASPSLFTIAPFKMSIADDSSSDAYKQFAEMLDMGSAKTRGPPPRSIPESQPAEDACIESEDAGDAYAEFSELLGVEKKEGAMKDVVISVPKAKPVPTDVLPEDYNEFDELLQQNGGMGKKRLKGSKRFISFKDVKQPPKKAGRTPIDARKGPDSVPVSADDVTASPVLSEDEMAQAYAVMMEEFGTGVHDHVQAWLPDSDIDDEERIIPVPTLQRPPIHPDRSMKVEDAVELEKAVPKESYDTDVDSASSQMEPVYLKEKPVFPGISDASHGTGEGLVISSEIETTKEFREDDPMIAVDGKRIVEASSHESMSAPLAESIAASKPALHQKPHRTQQAVDIELQQTGSTERLDRKRQHLETRKDKNSGDQAVTKSLGAERPEERETTIIEGTQNSTPQGFLSANDAPLLLENPPPLRPVPLEEKPRVDGQTLSTKARDGKSTIPWEEMKALILQNPKLVHKIQ